jgi:hypothetical protein
MSACEGAPDSLTISEGRFEVVDHVERKGCLCLCSLEFLYLINKVPFCKVSLIGSTGARNPCA